MVYSTHLKAPENQRFSNDFSRFRKRPVNFSRCKKRSVLMESCKPFTNLFLYHGNMLKH